MHVRAGNKECHFANVDRFWQIQFLPISAKIGPPWGTDIGSLNWSGRTNFGSKSGPAGPILGGTDFGVTGQSEKFLPHVATRCVNDLRTRR